MTLTNLAKFPAPYYGGKSHAASAVWSALGDVAHYVEPFCGTSAVLLLRPHESNRAYHSETINDADCLVVNALRSLAYAPAETADAASWYVTEADVMARQLAILEWVQSGNPDRVMAQPRYCDPLIAGWWLYGMSCWIGSGFASGAGPWIVGADGRITKRANGERGAWRQLPHLSNDGQGVNRMTAREPGVARQLPHLANNGQGVNHMTAREPGVARQLPHLANNGRGVNHGSAREPGDARQLPHLADNGRGVNHGSAREPGDDRACLAIPDDLVFHEMIMPELTRWFAFLSARLRHVRIVNGDWQRVTTTGAMKTLSIRQPGSTDVCGVFLDPPYGTDASRTMALYRHDAGDIAERVRAWCLANGPDPQLRIVLAGFADEGHEVLEQHGWRAVEWYTAGHIRGGYANQSESGTQQQRERLWMSPHCIKPALLSDLPMFADLDEITL